MVFCSCRCRFGLYRVILFICGRQCTFLDHICGSDILIFLSGFSSFNCNRRVISVIASVVLESDLICLCLSRRLLETDDTETQPKGKTNSPLSPRSRPLLFHTLIPEPTEALSIIQCQSNTELIADVRSPTWFYRHRLFNPPPLRRRSEAKQIH